MIERIIRNPFMHIYIANVNWPNDIKARPVLIVVKSDKHVKVYKITSVNPRRKPKKIGQNYISIMLWKQAGLDKPSWIDINHAYQLNRKQATRYPPVGKLQPEDVSHLFEILMRKYD